jgi:hypothetical protein
LIAVEPSNLGLFFGTARRRRGCGSNPGAPASHVRRRR